MDAQIGCVSPYKIPFIFYLILTVFVDKIVLSQIREGRNKTARKKPAQIRRILKGTDMEFFNFLQESNISQDKYDAASMSEKIALMNIFSEFKKKYTQSTPLPVFIVPNEKACNCRSGSIAELPYDEFVVNLRSKKIFNMSNTAKYPIGKYPQVGMAFDICEAIAWSPDMGSHIEPDFVLSNNSSDIIVQSKGVYEFILEGDWRGDFDYFEVFINNRVVLEFPPHARTGARIKERFQYLFPRGILLRRKDVICIKGHCIAAMMDYS